ncbi:MAG: hypothetical protein DI529_00155 [Chryseobacterium sp.]|nr:MAG: hypothetical protein DI529_00155 [Chryseobacterium sp.]
MFKVSILKSAKSDLRDASDYYGTISKELKARFLTNFNDTLNQLKEIPYFQIRFDEFRVRQVKNFPVMVHYIINEEKKVVKVYGIRFAKSNPDNYPKI